MKVKNISGERQYFGWGRETSVRGKLLDNNAVADVPDTEPTVRNSINGYIEEGKLQAVDGPNLTRRPSSEIRPANGWVKCNIDILDTHTVTIGGQVFEFAPDPGSATLGEYNSNLSSTDNVWAGAPNADDAVTAATLKQAINHLSSTLNLIARTERTVGTATYIPIERNDDEVDGTQTSLSAGQATIEVSGANLTDGVYGNQREQARFSHVVTSAEVSEGLIMVPTGIDTLGFRQMYTEAAANNREVGYDGSLTIQDGVFVFAQDGAVNFSAGDTIYILAEK